MKLSDFDYNLPLELIAQEPMKPRDHSRLLILHKDTGEIEHKKFFNIIEYLNEGDVLILNNSKVIPARLIGKKETGGQVEIFLSKKEGDQIENWECLIKGKNIKQGSIVNFEKDNCKLIAEIVKVNDNQTWIVKFNKSGSDFMKALECIGQVPLPPYIKKELTEDDKKDYQTVYANNKKEGSVAAPTAGFHFTEELLQKVKDRGAIIKYITLHVGLGTFLPVKTDEVEEHEMHAEWVEVDKEVIDEINQAKKDNKKIITVGTTSCRSMEAVYQKNDLDNDFKEWVDIFMYPPYQFKAVNTLITNFHLPKSTLLMLVSSLAGKENIDKAYKTAVEEKYRFFSYGDAMLII